jgi:hypothetical protein
MAEIRDLRRCNNWWLVPVRLLVRFTLSLSGALGRLLI